MASASSAARTPRSGGEPLVSIVVNNYNHGRFVGEAIESALAQTYANVEIIVVDDGSTDNSRAAISAFGSRTEVVLKENGGQGSAFNAGFERTSGSIIMFLDSDDLLYDSTVERVVEAFSTGPAAKVQFRLTVVDEVGRRMGEYPAPDARLYHGDAVPQLLRSGFYTTAVTSGNAYSRHALESVLPLPAAEFRYGADGYLNATVPFVGDVVAIDEALGAYRIHGQNGFAMNGTLDVGVFRSRIAHHLETERVIVTAARAAGYSAKPGLILRNAAHCEARLASFRLERLLHPIPSDRRLPLVARGVVATWRHLEISSVRRIADTGWFVAVGFLPRSAARSIVSWRHERSSRPAFVKAVVKRLNRILR